MYKLMLLVLCLASLAAAGGFTGLGMLLGAFGFGLGALALAVSAWQVLAH